MVLELIYEILICSEIDVKIPNPISKLLCLPDEQFSMCLLTEVLTQFYNRFRFSRNPKT